MRKITITLVIGGLIGTIGTFGLELFWRLQSPTFNIFTWQAGILLWTGAPSMAALFMGLALTNCLRDK
jgi:hypothetical protein